MASSNDDVYKDASITAWSEHLEPLENDDFKMTPILAARVDAIQAVQGTLILDGKEITVGSTKDDDDVIMFKSSKGEIRMGNFRDHFPVLESISDAYSIIPGYVEDAAATLEKVMAGQIFAAVIGAWTTEQAPGTEPGEEEGAIRNYQGWLAMTIDHEEKNENGTNCTLLHVHARESEVNKQKLLDFLIYVAELAAWRQAELMYERLGAQMGEEYYPMISFQVPNRNKDLLDALKNRRWRVFTRQYPEAVRMAVKIINRDPKQALEDITTTERSEPRTDWTDNLADVKSDYLGSGVRLERERLIAAVNETRMIPEVSTEPITVGTTPNTYGIQVIPYVDELGLLERDVFENHFPLLSRIAFSGNAPDYSEDAKNTLQLIDARRINARVIAAWTTVDIAGVKARDYVGWIAVALDPAKIPDSTRNCRLLHMHTRRGEQGREVLLRYLLHHAELATWRQRAVKSDEFPYDESQLRGELLPAITYRFPAGLDGLAAILRSEGWTVLNKGFNKSLSVAVKALVREPFWQPPQPQPQPKPAKPRAPRKPRAKMPVRMHQERAADGGPVGVPSMALPDIVFNKEEGDANSGVHITCESLGADREKELPYLTKTGARRVGNLAQRAKTIFRVGSETTEAMPAPGEILATLNTPDRALYTAWENQATREQPDIPVRRYVGWGIVSRVVDHDRYVTSIPTYVLEHVHRTPGRRGEAVIQMVFGRMLGLIFDDARAPFRGFTLMTAPLVQLDKSVVRELEKMAFTFRDQDDAMVTYALRTFIYGESDDIYPQERNDAVVVPTPPRSPFRATPPDSPARIYQPVTPQPTPFRSPIRPEPGTPPGSPPPSPQPSPPRRPVSPSPPPPPPPQPPPEKRARVPVRVRRAVPAIAPDTVDTRSGAITIAQEITGPRDGPTVVFFAGPTGSAVVQSQWPERKRMLLSLCSEPGDSATSETAYRATVSGLMSERGSVVIAAYKDEAIVPGREQTARRYAGYAIVSALEEPDVPAYRQIALSYLCVSREFRGAGVASALLRAYERAVAQQAQRPVWAFASIPASPVTIGYFARQGYTYPQGEPDADDEESDTMIVRKDIQ